MSLRMLFTGSLLGVMLALYLLWQGASGQRDAARRALQAAKDRAAARDATIAIEQAGARAVQRSLEREIHISVQAKEAAHEVAQVTGASTPLPPDVLLGWAGAVDRLRDEAAAAHGVQAAPTATGGAGSVPPPV